MKKEFNGHESNCLFYMYYDVGMIFQSYSMEYIVKKSYSTLLCYYYLNKRISLLIGWHHYNNNHSDSDRYLFPKKTLRVSLLLF